MSKKKDEVKDKAEEMIYQVLKYINASGLSQNEQNELKVELGASFVTCAIDFDFEDKAKTLSDLIDTLDDFRTIAVAGTLSVLAGEREYKTL